MWGTVPGARLSQRKARTTRCRGGRAIGMVHKDEVDRAPPDPGDNY
ncbi:MAG: hypothetical protein H0T92_09765 [Pyrinomonadaceae bacterium]|nr:hypothetical protein [Pyrinomonadaceae bacterium]